MRTPDAEKRFLSRRALTVDRVLDLNPELRAQLAVKALMILATDMPAIATLVLDQAEAMTPPIEPRGSWELLPNLLRTIPVQR